MTPSEFKSYRESKKANLDELKNSKPNDDKGKPIMFKLFRTAREEISNSNDITDDTFIEFEGKQVAVSDIRELANSKKHKMSKIVECSEWKSSRGGHSSSAECRVCGVIVDFGLRIADWGMKNIEDRGLKIEDGKPAEAIADYPSSVAVLRRVDGMGMILKKHGGCQKDAG